MPQPELKITCRIEEVPAIGGFLIDSLGTDLADFTLFSPEFTAGYVTTAQTQHGTITALLQPKTLTAELKVITLRMYNNMSALELKIDALEYYIKQSTGLTVAAKDFGISAIRKARNKKDVEKLNQALNYTLGLTDNATNAPILLAKGFTAAKSTELHAINDKLHDDNVEQNAKINARNNLVANNYGAINDFWKILVQISDAGRRIYKKSNKVDDYTMAALKRRIRQEQLRNKMAGNVTSNGLPFVDAKIEMRPVLGGRLRSTKSKATGKYELKSLVATDWIVSVSAPGKVTQNLNVTILTGETLTMNFVMVDV